MFDEVVSEDAVRRFCHVATKRLGVEIDRKLDSLIAGRVAKRLQALQLPLDEYMSRLDDEHCEEIVDFLDFVRPRPPRFFSRWSDHAELHAQVRRWVRQGRRKFRFWSAGCGSGEEAYAMVLATQNAVEGLGLDLDAIDLKILATDFSQQALDAGKRGLFNEGQLERVPPSLRYRFFQETDAGLAIDAGIRSHVVFRRLNLVEPPYPMSRLLDAIFCHEGLRALIPGARRHVFGAARRLLADDGIICCGFEDDIAVPAEEAESQRKRRSPSRDLGYC